MNPLILRDYQEDLANAVRAAFAAGFKAPLVVLSTGGGKTTIFSYVTQGATRKGRRVWLLAHRAELCRQISLTLARFGVEHRICAPGPIVRQIIAEQFRAFRRSWVNPTAPAMVASVQTLVKRLDKQPDAPDVIVIDEAHHLTAGSTWGQIVSRYPDAKLLPVTATPCRLDGRGLGKASEGFADEIVQGPSMRWLIDSGYLSEYRVFAPPVGIDLKGVKTMRGDYKKDDLARAVDKPKITGDVVAHYQRLAPGRRAVAFCVSVAHAEHVAAEFRAAGVPAETLDGSLDPGEREARIKRFEAGTTQVVTSADLISEGFDLPAIEVAILLRPTKSLSLYLQQVGRALRVFPGKVDALILDHVGAIRRHGLPDEDRNWTLAGAEKKAANDNGGAVAIRTCPMCFTIHRPAPTCPSCGHVYQTNGREIEQAEGVLVELTPEAKAELRAKAEQQKRDAQVQRKREERDCKTLAELTALGEQRGYKHAAAWAERILGFRENYRRAG